MQQRVRARPLTAYIVGLALAMTVPPFLLAAATAVRWVSAEQSRVRADTLATVTVAQELVDRYVSGRIAMLQALATSPSLDDGDFGRLDAQARELLDRQGLNIVLRDMDGRQRVNTRRPRGAPLPAALPGLDERTIEATRAPLVGGLHHSAVAGAPVLRVMVPVMREGVVRFTLAASFEPSALSAMLRQAGVNAPFGGSVADGNGLILARNDARAELVGKPLPGYAELIGPSGTWSGKSPIGTDIVGAYRRSTVSDWVFMVGIDQAALDAPIYRSIWGMLALALALGLIAFGASVFLARRIIVSLRQVAAEAVTLGEGRVVEAPLTSVREANLIGAELSRASARLHEQAEALAAANRDLETRVEARTREARSQAAVIRATLDNMDQGLLLIEAGGRVPVWNRRVLDLLDLPESLFDPPPLFVDILRFQLERDDFARSGEALRRWVENGALERYPHSYERERPNGTVIEIRTVPLADGSAVRTYTDITERKRAERLSEHLAHHDPLTGLPNRRLFHDRLAEQIAGAGVTGAPFAAFYLDLDRFKIVNDTLGHAAGDSLLWQVAERVRATVGRGDTVARLGGDEFAVIQVDPDQPAAAERLARALNDAMKAPVEVEGQPYAIGVSIGIATSRGESDPDTLFGEADTALYRAKREGRNTYRFHDASWGTDPAERQLLEFDLQHALARSEFELRYQPILSAGDRTIVGFEALLRWRHPERGMVPPVEFIALAEETRLIMPIGAWVLEEACRAAVSWPPHVTIAVNISAIQIEHDHLFQTVTSALTRSGLAPHRLELEITESVLARGHETVLDALRLLRGLGIRVALDDFGTGYSSLSYLQSFPLDRIKIDRSFTSMADERSTAAIMRAIVGLGTELGMAITAEGVETDAQFAIIRQQGCTDVQGYLFSPPVPLANATALLTRESVRQVA